MIKIAQLAAWAVSISFQAVFDAVFRRPIGAGGQDIIQHLPFRVRQRRAAEEGQGKTAVGFFKIRDPQPFKLALDIGPVQRAALALPVHIGIQYRVQTRTASGKMLVFMGDQIDVKVLIREAAGEGAVAVPDQPVFYVLIVFVQLSPVGDKKRAVELKMTDRRCGPELSL